jgi:hypothetical protein
MKDISQIDADSRDGMVCPHCGESKLKALPIAAEKSSKKEKILYGTTCANPNCTKHGDRVDPNGLAKQYDSTRFENILSKNTLFFIAVLLVGALIAAQTMGIFSLNPGTTENPVSGTIVGPDGDSVSGATVIIGNKTATTNSTGSYTLDIKSGSYEMVVLPPSNSTISGSPTYNISVSSDGSIDFLNSNNQTTSTINLENAYSLEAETKSSNSSVFVKYKNPSNGGMTIVHLTGSKEDTRTTEKEIQLATGTNNIPISGTPTNQSIKLTSPIATTQKTIEYTYTGTEETLDVSGNMDPTNVRVIFDSGKETTLVSKTERINGEQTVPINVQSSGDEELIAYLSEGSSQEVETKNGIWTNSDPSITISEESAPATVHVTLTGGIQTTTESINGTVTDGTATFNVDGNIQAKNGVITFNGGEATNTEIDSGSVYASGEEGTTLRKTTIADAPSDGEYILDFSHTIEENPEYVSAGYMVNGEKTTIEEGSGTVSLNLEKGDTVEVWVKSSNEVSQNDKQHSSENNNIEITDYTAYPTEPSSDEPINFEVTAKNTGDEADNIDVVIYLNGESVTTETMVVEAGETKTKTLDTSINPPSDGVHTVSVNDLDETIIRVNGATLESGAGTVDATLSKKGDEGTINVDTNNDGEYDCTVSAESGSCSLNQLPTGENTIQIKETGVSNTDYTVTYTKREGPKGVTIDLNNDGNIDKRHDGLLTSDETITISKTLEAGEHTIDIETESGDDINYDIEWSKAGVINSPTILIDGETVVDSSETYSGTKEFNLGAVSPGEHQVTFKSKNGSYTAKLEWEEQPENQYPSVRVNGTEICNSNTVSNNGGYCNIPQSHASKNMKFKLGQTDTGEDFTVEYTERSAPKEVTIENDTTSKTIKKSDGEISDGKWIYNAPISILSENNTIISVESNYPSGFESELTGVLKYTEKEKGPQNPKITVIQPNGEKHSKRISSSKLENGILNSSETIHLPYNWFGKGENEIRIISSNGVPIETRIVTRSTINQTVSFNED